MVDEKIVEYSKNAYKKFGISQFKILKTTGQGNFLVGMGNKDDRRYLIKIANKADSSQLNKISLEIANMNFLDRTIHGSKFYTSVIGSWDDDDYKWLLREYIEGGSLSLYQDSDEVLMGYDSLSSEYLNRGDEITGAVVEKVYDLQAISDFLDYKFAPQRFWSSFSDDDGLKLLDIHQLDARPALDYFSKHRVDYFAAKKIKISNCDLVPSNIIVSKDGRVYLTDFEWMTLDNYMMDFAQLWLYLWRYQNWQQSLLKKAIKSDADKENFRLSVVRAVLTFLLTATTAKKVQYYKNHLWRKYLIAASESFESLMNIK